MSDPVPYRDVEDELLAADAAARRPEVFARRLESVGPMTAELWGSLAIEDLSEAEADAFWQTIAG